MDDQQQKKAARPKTRRQRVKYPALNPMYNLKIRHDELSDFDYLDKLNDSEKKFLNDFLDGYVNASSKSKMFESKTENYKRNNRRNRDLYARAKCQNKLTYFSRMSKAEESSAERLDHELDKLILKIDMDKGKV